MRRALTSLCRTLLRLFFRRIEITGIDNVPRDRPVIFAANHPNGLVDPLFILCFAPRRVSFLAKAPLFRYPVIGYFVRVFESIPVYRRQDNTAGSNAETFARAQAILRGGGSIAIFPEGTTHSDPHLRELKTGAARIALGAGLPELVIVPVGIYYTAKQTFRSEALVWFGESMEVSATETVEGLTERIEQQLASVTLQADSQAALDLITRAERIFSAGVEQPLASQLELRRRFTAGYHYLREHEPARLERLASEVRQIESELGGAGLVPEDLSWRVAIFEVARTTLLLPFAIAGIIIHFIPYLIVDFFAKRLSHDEDEMTATIKFLASLLFYPLTWITIAILIGGIAGVIALFVMPFLGWVALRVIETIDEAIGSLRAVIAHSDLIVRRRALRDEFVAVAERINV